MLTVVIPTLNRDQILLDTLRHLLAQNPAPDEILVVDQTKQHKDDVRTTLMDLYRARCIKWLQMPAPSVTKAMNWGLVAANCEIVLFLDDDIIPVPGLVAAHFTAHNKYDAGLVAGRVVQPWEENLSRGRSHFAQTRPAWISDFMGGNFSVRRDLALAIGGFDENFVRVGYRFEAEFAYRLRQAEHRIYFEPAACIHHLKVGSGGTRTFGDHLRSFKPNHSVGAYYCYLRTWSGWPSFAAFLSRLPRAIANRHHLRRPWWIPATVVAELSGMMWAILLTLRGPRYLKTSQSVDHKC